MHLNKCTHRGWWSRSTFGRVSFLRLWWFNDASLFSSLANQELLTSLNNRVPPPNTLNSPPLWPVTSELVCEFACVVTQSKIKANSSTMQKQTSILLRLFFYVLFTFIRLFVFLKQVRISKQLNRFPLKNPVQTYIYICLVDRRSCERQTGASVYESWTTKGNNVFCFLFFFPHIVFYFEIHQE